MTGKNQTFISDLQNTYLDPESKLFDFGDTIVNEGHNPEPFAFNIADEMMPCEQPDEPMEENKEYEAYRQEAEIGVQSGCGSTLEMI